MPKMKTKNRLQRLDSLEGIREIVGIVSRFVLMASRISPLFIRLGDRSHDSSTIKKLMTRPNRIKIERIYRLWTRLWRF